MNIEDNKYVTFDSAIWYDMWSSACRTIDVMICSCELPQAACTECVTTAQYLRHTLWQRELHQTNWTFQSKLHRATGRHLV